MTTEDFFNEEKKMMAKIKPIVDSTPIPSGWPEGVFKIILTDYLAFKGTDSIDPRTTSYEQYQKAMSYWGVQGAKGTKENINNTPQGDKIQDSPYKIGDKVHVIHKVEHDWEYGVKETNIKEFNGNIMDIKTLHSIDGSKEAIGYEILLPDNTTIITGLDSIKYKIVK